MQVTEKSQCGLAQSNCPDPIVIVFARASQYNESALRDDVTNLYTTQDIRRTTQASDPSSNARWRNKIANKKKLTGYKLYLEHCRGQWSDFGSWDFSIRPGAVSHWIVHGLAVGISKKRNDVTRKFEKYEGSTCVTYVNQVTTTWSVMMDETISINGGLSRKFKYKDKWVKDNGIEKLSKMPASLN